MTQPEPSSARAHDLVIRDILNLGGAFMLGASALCLTVEPSSAFWQFVEAYSAPVEAVPVLIFLGGFGVAGGLLCFVAAIWAPLFNINTDDVRAENRNPLRRPSISEVFDVSFTVFAFVWAYLTIFMVLSLALLMMVAGGISIFPYLFGGAA
ncbi:MAG: hypothetical protein IPK75_12875 [Acidobacteria bacterium]|nr:hypothetical protein [Acidobacteriota bacterium]